MRTKSEIQHLKIKRAGYCLTHNEGPLDVWHDCLKCCEIGKKKEALKGWHWLPISEILEEISDKDRIYWLTWWHGE